MRVSTMLLRTKRRTDKLADHPWLRRLGKGAAFFGSGLVLSGASLWGAMQPIAMGLVLGSTGWWCLWAALGSSIGYRLMWQEAGLQGVVWVLGAAVVSVTLPFFEGKQESRWRRAISSSCLVAAAGIAFRFRQGTSPPVSLTLLRLAIAAVSAMTAHLAIQGKNRLGLWIGAALLTMGFARMPLPAWCSPGVVILGLLAAVAPLPAAVLAGFGLELTQPGGLSFPAVAVLAQLWQQLPISETIRRPLGPVLGMISVMALQGKWEPGLVVSVSLGSLLGALLPWRLTALPRRRSLSGVQVQLEQAAFVLTGFQRSLIAYSLPPVDKDADEETRKRILALRAQQEACRLAAAQQYGFLADLLHTLADGLPRRTEPARPKYRVQVSSRSKSAAIADGDRVMAFPGGECRYYVVLCDGMGRGLGAQEEGDRAALLMKQMLTAGITPKGALESLNSHLALLGRGGAVTVDLAELHLDTGAVRLYKWGAAPSWVLRRGAATAVGNGTAPPGLGVSVPGEQMSRVHLGSGAVLVMVSDGVENARAQLWAQDIRGDPGLLAQRILAESAPGEDDATAVVIRMMEKSAR